MKRLAVIDSQWGSARFLLVLVLGGVCVYAAVKLAMPYYAYKDLERTMSYWGKVALLRGDENDSELREKIAWVIDRHHIPLHVNEVRMEHNRSQRTLTLWAAYEVSVTFPGYEHVFHFKPYVQVVADES